MSTNKTPNLNLHSWVGTDYVSRTEFNENFNTIDAEIVKVATQSQNGRMSSSDKTKLDSLQSGSTSSTANTTAVRDVNGDLTTRQFKSTATAGTAPMTVTSTTVVANLNADKLDGYDAGNASGNIPVSNGTLNTNLNADKVDGYDASTSATASTVATRDSNGDLSTRQFKSTATTGTAPFSTNSTTLVTNFNADMVDGFDAGTAGGTEANSLAVTDASGRVGDSKKLAGSTLDDIQCLIWMGVV